MTKAHWGTDVRLGKRPPLAAVLPAGVVLLQEPAGGPARGCRPPSLRARKADILRTRKDSQDALEESGGRPFVVPAEADPHGVVLGGRLLDTTLPKFLYQLQGKVSPKTIVHRFLLMLCTF
jgi:hypothetical protein